MSNDNANWHTVVVWHNNGAVAQIERPGPTILLAVSPSEGNLMAHGAAPSATVVLVHSAFADAAGYFGIDLELEHDSSVRTASGRAFCPDIPVGAATVMATTQHSAAGGTLAESHTAAASKTKSSWCLVSDRCNAISSVAESFVADRAEATTETINWSRTALIAQPVARYMVCCWVAPSREFDWWRPPRRSKCWPP
jgi:hypothetical protein